MPGIFPELVSGGVVVRDALGVCLNPPTVQNAYCPPDTFVTSCEITALPSDCTARLSAAQINTIVSELISFAECLNPIGPWNCASTSNLCAAFNVWAAGFAMTAVEIVTSICASNPAGDALAACLISIDGGNVVTLGGDGRLYAAPGGPAAPALFLGVLPPVAPAIGRMWLNTAAIVVSGISAGAEAYWDGANWIQKTFGSVTIIYTPKTNVADGVTQIFTPASVVRSGPDEFVNIAGNNISVRPGKYQISAKGSIRPTIGATSSSVTTVISPLKNGAAIAFGGGTLRGQGFDIIASASTYSTMEVVPFNLSALLADTFGVSGLISTSPGTANVHDMSEIYLTMDRRGN